MNESESEVTQLYPTPSDPMDRSLPGSSVHGIFPGKSTGVRCHCLLLATVKGWLGLIFLGQEDPLEEGMATHSSILAWKNPMDRGASWVTMHRVAKSWTRLSTQHSTHSHKSWVAQTEELSTGTQ